METTGISDHLYIFACGLHRSGNSVLFRSLRDHPEDEGMHLQSVYLPSGRYRGAGEFGFHPEAHLTEWSRYWDLDKTYLLAKSPPNIIRTRFLQAMFPNSYFIVMLRHPLAVSYATQKWYRKYKINWRGFPRIFEHWLISHETFQTDQKHLKNSFVVKYEDFIAEPYGWVNEMYRFPGLSDDSVIRKILSDMNKKYFKKWNEKLCGFLSGLMNRRIIAHYEDQVRCFGYSLTDPVWIGPIAE